MWFNVAWKQTFGISEPGAQFYFDDAPAYYK